MGSKYFICRDAIFDLGARPFSPLHDVGVGAAEAVAPASWSWPLFLLLHVPAGARNCLRRLSRIVPERLVPATSLDRESKRRRPPLWVDRLLVRPAIRPVTATYHSTSGAVCPDLEHSQYRVRKGPACGRGSPLFAPRSLPFDDSVTPKVPSPGSFVGSPTVSAPNQ